MQAFSMLEDTMGVFFVQSNKQETNRAKGGWRLVARLTEFA